MYPLWMAQQRPTPTITNTATAITVPAAVETAIPTASPEEELSTPVCGGSC